MITQQNIQNNVNTEYNRIDMIIMLSGWERWTFFCNLYSDIANDVYVDIVIATRFVDFIVDNCDHIGARGAAWSVYLAVRFSYQTGYLWR